MNNTVPDTETLPTTHAGWLHRCDQRFAEGYQKGRASAQAQADERILAALQLLEDAYFKRGLPAFETAAEHIEHAASHVAAAGEALDMLAGLHPCLTTDDPAEMAKQIFDAVMSERSAHAQELANHARNLEFRDALIARWRAGMRELIAQRMGAEAIRERLQSLLAGAAKPSHP